MTTSRRALITGVDGFAGSWLAEELLGQGWQVAGTARRPGPHRNLDACSGRVEVHQVDLTAYAPARAVLERADPEVVFHLAGRSSVAGSFLDPEGTILTNVGAQLNVLRALREMGSRSRVVVAGSSHVYGQVPAERMPLDETAPLLPADPYSFSKVAQDFLALQYFLSDRLPIIRLRLFSHTGPRQGTGFSLSDFARQVAEAEAGRTDPVISVGNLDARRDFSDVRDIARAYRLAAELGEPGEVYNVGTGRTEMIGDLLARLVAQARVPVEVRTDPERLRPSDLPILQCNPARFQGATGWRPEIPLEQTLTDLLDSWRERVAGAVPA
ncbi:MAG: GDP-mannose 4,6-dehydratase [Candidatus Dormibacteria bacterium]